MQTIQTKFLAPTNFRGSRISVSTSGGKRKIIKTDHSLNIEQNHTRAAKILRDSLGWQHYEMIGGENCDGKGFTYVIVNAPSWVESLTIKAEPTE